MDQGSLCRDAWVVFAVLPGMLTLLCHMEARAALLSTPGASRAPLTGLTYSLEQPAGTLPLPSPGAGTSDVQGGFPIHYSPNTIPTVYPGSSPLLNVV